MERLSIAIESPLGDSPTPESKRGALTKIFVKLEFPLKICGQVISIEFSFERVLRERGPPRQGRR